MKFFSREWHRGDLADDIAEQVPAAYLDHLRSLQPPAPPAAIRLAEEISLHDGLIREVRRDRANLRLVVRAGDLQVGYYDAALVYEGAVLSPQDEGWLDASVGDRDIEVLYDEFDAGSDGTWIHRFLFWPYHEVAIRCRGIDMHVSRVRSRFEDAT